MDEFLKSIEARMNGVSIKPITAEQAAENRQAVKILQQQKKATAAVPPLAWNNAANIVNSMTEASTASTYNFVNINSNGNGIFVGENGAIIGKNVSIRRVSQKCAKQLPVVKPSITITCGQGSNASWVSLNGNAGVKTLLQVADHLKWHRLKIAKDAAEGNAQLTNTVTSYDVDDIAYDTQEEVAKFSLPEMPIVQLSSNVLTPLCSTLSVPSVATQPYCSDEKYACLLATIEEMKRDIRPVYLGSRCCFERFRRDLNFARGLINEIKLETAQNQ